MPAPFLHITLLGGFQTRWASGARVDLANKKTQGLLAYLALPAGRAQSRERLLGLLWSDRAEPQARNSLRQALAELGRALGSAEPSPLVKAQDRIALDLASVEVDAMVFERLATSDEIEELRRAVGLYAGDLLEGIGIRDAAFEEWLLQERQRMRDLAIDTLKKLLSRETGGEAIATARRLLSFDPVQEDGHRALMRLQAEAGDIGAALRQYEICRETLKREIGVEPSAETEALHRGIRQPPVKAERRGGEGTAASSPAASPRNEGSGPSKPSIAVLPFANMGNDPEQEYFTDGITEDIITELSRFRSLVVIARKSSLQYRGPDIDVKQIGQQLGVRYVAEGSVRKAGNRIRISAQLIDVSTGNHLWAERFDRDLGDVFAIQDEVARTIVSTLAVRLEDEGLAIARRKPPESMQAYDHWLRGKNCLDLWTKQGNTDAISFFEKAIEIDPEYARGHAGLALACEWADFYSAWGGGDPSLPERAEGSALKAVRLDPTDYLPHVTLAWIYNERDAFERSRRHLDLAEALNPNDADMLINRAAILCFHGEPDEALVSAQSAIRLNPHYPDYYLAYLGHCYRIAGRLEEALAQIEGLRSTFPEWHAGLAGICAQLGRLEEAKRHIDRFVSEFPSYWLGDPSASFLVNRLFHYRRKADADMFFDSLVKAGLPE